MLNCDVRNISQKLSLIIIAGSINSSNVVNKLRMKIDNLPLNYQTILKDDENDDFILSSTSINVLLNWGKNETDGFIVTNIDELNEIIFQFEELLYIKDVFVFSNNYHSKYSIYEPLYFKKIDDEYLINNITFKPYQYIQSPIEFYNYYYNYSLNAYQISDAVVIIPYLHLLSLSPSNKRKNTNVECSEILPIITRSEYDKRIKDIEIKKQNDLAVKNIERCKILTYMTKNCDPCSTIMDKCPTKDIKNTWNKYYGSFPMWWVNKNIKSFISCDLLSPCQEVCESGYKNERLYTLKIDVYNGGTNDIIISDPKGIYSNVSCEYKFKFGQHIKIKFIPTPGYIIIDCVGCDRFVDNIAYINFTGSSNIKFYLKHLNYNLSISIIGNGDVVSSSHVGINCGINCSYDYKRNTSISLYAIPKIGNSFIQWVGADSILNDTCVVNMTNDKNLQAIFTSI